VGTTLRVGAAAVVLLVLVVAVAWVLQRRLVYLPFGTPDGPAATVFDGGRDVVLRTEDGLELTAWWAPATGPARGSTVLVAPGNGGSRALRVPLARALAGEGFDVLLLEYRGYGGNPGSPTEEGLAADVRAAHRYLVEDRGVPPDRLLLFGESLGGAALTRLATERPVGGLVLRSPFTSLADVGARAYPFLPVRALLRDRFRDRAGRAEPRRRRRGGCVLRRGPGGAAQRPRAGQRANGRGRGGGRPRALRTRGRAMTHIAVHVGRCPRLPSFSA
jgi:pimeloyl-ACP methyl ester carboxylesterase